jgi:hypothetical protein
MLARISNLAKNTFWFCSCQQGVRVHEMSTARQNAAIRRKTQTRRGGSNKDPSVKQ